VSDMYALYRAKYVDIGSVRARCIAATDDQRPQLIRNRNSSSRGRAATRQPIRCGGRFEMTIWRFDSLLIRIRPD